MGRLAIFSTRLPFSVRSLLCLFKQTQMIHAAFVKVAPGRPKTDRVKFKISPCIGEAKFSLAEGRGEEGKGEDKVRKLEQSILIFAYIK